MTGEKVSRPYRVMFTRQWSSIRHGHVTLPKPRCAGTYTTRERAEASISSWWRSAAGAYVEGPDDDKVSRS